MHDIYNTWEEIVGKGYCHLRGGLCGLSSFLKQLYQEETTEAVIASPEGSFSWEGKAELYLQQMELGEASEVIGVIFLKEGSLCLFPDSRENYQSFWGYRKKGEEMLTPMRERQRASFLKGTPGVFLKGAPGDVVLWDSRCVLGVFPTLPGGEGGLRFFYIRIKGSKLRKIF